MHHYKGRSAAGSFRFGATLPRHEPNLPPKLLEFLATKYKTPVTAEDFLAYLAGVAANPAYTARFQADLAQPGLRIPLTTEAEACSRRPSSWAGG